MKELTSLLQLVDDLQQAGKIDNLQLAYTTSYLFLRQPSQSGRGQVLFHYFSKLIVNLQRDQHFMYKNAETKRLIVVHASTAQF